MPIKKINGKTIIRKTRRVRYFGTRRVHLEYPVLKTPVTELTAWFIDEDGREAGYLVTPAQYEKLDVPETTDNTDGERRAWQAERAKAERNERRYRNSGFVRP